MGQGESDTPTPSGFPPYRRSHLRSKTYVTLVAIFSRLPPDNGNGRMEQEKQKKGPESEFVGSSSMDPKDPIANTKIQEIHETIEKVEDKGRELGGNDMVLREVEQMKGMEEDEEFVRKLLQDMAKEADFKMHEKLMDELELTEDLVCSNGLIALNLGQDEKQNDNNEVNLMDNDVEHVELQHADVNKSINASELQVHGEHNQLASESCHPSLMVDLSTSTHGQSSALVISTSSTKQERQKNELDLVKKICASMDSLANIRGGEFEKEQQCCPKVPKALHGSSDHTTSGALNVCEDGKLLNSAIVGDKHEMKNEEKLQKSICANKASNSSNVLIEDGEIEEGELVGDSGMDGNSFGTPSADSLVTHLKKIDEVQKPKSIVKETVFPGKTGSGEKGYKFNLFTVNTHQDRHNSGLVEPQTSSKNGLTHGVEVEISREIVKYDDIVDYGSMPTNYAQNQVMHKGLLEKYSNQDHGNSSTSKQTVVDHLQQMVGASDKKKRGPISEGKKAKKKEKKRKRRAEKNKQLGVKRLKLPPVQKPKTVSYCRHYLVGRCYEGDKCKFSHDTVPLTKSTPCSYFARNCCMKGADCPFDHQLSKYPCNNFFSGGYCSRGDACLFSHQLSTKEDIPTSSNFRRPELKSPLPSGNRSFGVPPNNHGRSSIQLNHFKNPVRIQSPINSEHKVMDTVQKKLTPVPRGVSFIKTSNSTLPKGVSFIKISNSPLPSPSTPKQGVITPNTESPVQIGICVDQSASHTSQTLVEIPKKSPDVEPKGTLVEILEELPAKRPKRVNFLSFDKGSVSGFESCVSYLSKWGNDDMMLLEYANCDFPNHASSSLKKDDCSKAIDDAIDPGSNEIFDTNQSVSERAKSSFDRKAMIDDAVTDLQDSSDSNADQSHSKPDQEVEKASDNPQSKSDQEVEKASEASTVASSLLLAFPLSLERLQSGNHEHASNFGRRTLLSTSTFAGEHATYIKMKDPVVA